MSVDWRKCIICADSRDVIKRIPDNSVDFIFTDPPYNIGKHSTGNIPLPGRTAMNNDVAAWDWVDFNPEEWADEFIRILKPTGNLFIFTSYNQIGRWYNCLDHKFDTSNFMIWHKTNPAPKIFKAGFLNSCEMIFTCWNKKHTWNFISQAEMHNFIESPICMSPERIKQPKHPAQKPVAILKKIITIATNEHDIILDPFMGLASIGVAALELNRRYIGIDVDRIYYEAANNRINEVMKNKNMDNATIGVSEPFVMDYHPSTLAYYDMQFIFDDNRPREVDNNLDEKQYSFSPTGLSPIIKWAGGKEKELKFIFPNLPHFNNYFEPFVGGGSVYMSIDAKKYCINDLSYELMDLYINISKQDENFFRLSNAIEASWISAKRFFESNYFLMELYNDYRNHRISKEQLRDDIKSFCFNKSKDIENILDNDLRKYPSCLNAEMQKNIFRKMTRMRDLEEKKTALPESDIKDNIETAIKSALYMNFRAMYNNKELTNSDSALRCALFLFIRNYAYSGMFRYNDAGDFNVPYGGIAYNSKSLNKKLSYYQSASLLAHFNKTEFYNLDFESFLECVRPTKDDFIFLDPPYDTEFSTYAQNDFTKADQERLANYLLNKCKAKWMLVIKYTEFIFNLYNKEGINIRQFDKEYLVSFMNRNEKKAIHLLITNY